MKLPPEIESLPDRIRALEDENRELRRKVGYVMRANATYSAGRTLLHREHDETRAQLALAMQWGRALVGDRTSEQVSRETPEGE